MHSCESPVGEEGLQAGRRVRVCPQAVCGQVTSGPGLCTQPWVRGLEISRPELVLFLLYAQIPSAQTRIPIMWM